MVLSETFGPYEVYERVGIGGMATVHRAVKRGIEGFEQVVALKRLLQHLAEDSGFVTAFVREAKLAALLQHPNIVRIYELGRVEGVYFISMEYLEGVDLRKLLMAAHARAAPPPLGAAVALLRSLCEALHYAHNLADPGGGAPLGLVHRDVSPSNLLVTRTGHLKVIDFGIAKATQSHAKTDTGGFKGKLGYTSPEAAVGQPIDRRSDIFSAGVVAYELLTARPLFTSKTEYETLNRVVTADVPAPSTLNPRCPPELDEVVLRALAKAPEERWATASDVRDALDEVALRHNVEATTTVVTSWLLELENIGPTSPAAEIPLGLDTANEEEQEVVELVWGEAKTGELELETSRPYTPPPHPFSPNEILGADRIMTSLRPRPQDGTAGGAAEAAPPAHDDNPLPRLRVGTRCSDEKEFILVFSHLYQDNSLLIFTDESRPVGSRADITITLHDERKVLGGRGEVLESIGAGPSSKPAMRIRFLSLDPDSFRTWNRLRRLSSRTVTMWKLDRGKEAAGEVDPGQESELDAASRGKTSAMWKLERLRYTQQMLQLSRPPAEPKAPAADLMEQAPAPDSHDTVRTPQWLLLQDVDELLPIDKPASFERRDTDLVPRLERSGMLEASLSMPSIPVDELVECSVVEVNLGEEMELVGDQQPAEPEAAGLAAARETSSTERMRRWRPLALNLSPVAFSITAASVAITLVSIAYILSR